MARPELERSGLLFVDLESGNVDYQELFEKALQLLRHDDERYLHIARKLDAIIESLECYQLPRGIETWLKLREVADYSRVMAGQLPKYGKSSPVEKRRSQGTKEHNGNGRTNGL